MKLPLTIGLVAAVAAVVPAIAQPASQAPAATSKRMDWNQPQTRADAEAKAAAMFDRMDVNKDGFVTEGEPMQAMTAQRAARHAQMFDRIDTNRDGSISRAEFDAHHAAMAGPGQRMGARDGRRDGAGRGGAWGHAMTIADTNRDGRVSRDEAMATARSMFDRADANRDGTVTPEERRAAMRDAMAQWRAMKR